MHEYGGGVYAVEQGVDGLRQPRGPAALPAGRPRSDDPPVPITPEGVHRYAEPVLDLRRRRVVAIREDHTDPAAPVNTLVSLDLDGENADGGRVIVEGSDFVISAST